MKRTKLSLKRPHESQENNEEKRVKTIDQIETSDAKGLIRSNGDRNRGSTENGDSEIKEKFTCEICKKELTHFNMQRRLQHINRCADEQIEADTILQLVYQCPFCRKDLSHNAKTNHLKLCARSNGVTDPEKLIKVNQLMEKQAEERRALRLPTAVSKPKAINKPKGKNKLDPELQMALAISLSLKEENDRQNEAELFEFGIPAATSTTNSIQERRRKRKPENVLLPRLMTVTPKEKAELLQIKISQVLDEEDKMQILNINDIMGRKRDVEASKHGQIKSPVLWRKASSRDTELDDNLFSLVASKRKMVSDIPGRDSTQIPLENQLREAGESSHQQIDRTEKLINTKFSDNEMINLGSLATDFESLVGNPKLSDVTIRTKDRSIIYAHRLILFARCLPLYEETEVNENSILDWSMVSTESARTFLSFLYTARLVSTSENVLKDMKILAKKYDVHQLLETLAEKSFIASPECFSPDLLPLSDHDVDLTDNDDDYCISPTINSQMTRKCDADANVKSETSTPIRKMSTPRDRLFSVSTITTSDDNEIEASFSPSELRRTAPFGDVIRDSEAQDDIKMSCYSPIISEVNYSILQRKNSFDELQDEACVVGSISPKIIDANQSSDSIQCLDDDDDFFDVSRMCYSRTESFRDPEPAQVENISWRDYDDCNYDLSRDPSLNSSPLVDPLLPDTPILPLAQRIKKSKNPEKPIPDARVTPKKLTSDANRKVVRRKKQISASQPVVTNITPKPNYIDMNTPAIRQQLKKFGLRQLPNKKAIQMLEHIYEGTHPLVTDSEHENSTIEKSIKMADHETEDGESGSQSDPLNESQELLEETCFLDESPCPPTDDISEAFKTFVRSRPDIYKKILLYEPLNFNELHSEIKNSGLKIKMATLKELLDKQCITFTLPRDRDRPKQRGRKTKKM